jgi:type I restriction enzyme S subunit
MTGEVPEGWAVRRVGEFAQDVSDRAPERPVEVFSVTKHSGFTPSLEYFGKQVYSKDTTNYKLVRRGQFAYATIHLDEGSIDCLTSHDEGIISPMYTVFDVDPTVVDRSYVLDLLSSALMIQRYQGMGLGSVNRRKSISFDTLARELILLPPLPEQKKIAAILSSVDEAIQKTKAVIEQTRTVKKGLLQELLTRGLPGHTRFKQTEIGEIPEGWAVQTIGSLTIESAFGPRFSSNEYDADGNYATMRTTDIDADWVLNYTTMPIARLPEAEFDKHVLREGDLLVTRSGTCGVAVVYQEGKASLPVIPGAFLIRFRLNRRKVNPQFLLAVFQGRSLQDALASFMAGGVQKNLSGSNIKKLLVPLPPMAEQEEIVSRLSDVESVRDTQVTCLDELHAVRAGLLQDLLSGRVRVTP